MSPSLRKYFESVLPLLRREAQNTNAADDHKFLDMIETALTHPEQLGLSKGAGADAAATEAAPVSTPAKGESAEPPRSKPNLETPPRPAPGK